MTDENLNAGATTSNTEAAATQASGTTEAPEKTLSQDEVNKIVGATKADAFEKGRLAALAQANKDADLASTTPIDAVTVTKAELRKMAEEEAVNIASQQQAEAVVKQFVAKVETGKTKHENFDTVVAKLNIPSLKNAGVLVDILNKMDNTADVLYEMGTNPSKFAQVISLIGETPELALSECNKLSSSIKKNTAAEKKTKESTVNAPLDQLKPSLNGINDGDPKCVADYRKLDYLRG